jgi:uncharacterized membrane protein
MEAVLPAHDPRRTLPRLLLSILAGAMAAWGFRRFGWPVRLEAGWSALSATELALSWWLIASSGPERTRRWAESEDPGRTFLTVVVIFGCALNLLLAIYLLRRAGALAPEFTRALVALSLTAVAGSWMVTHTAYSAYYARCYYRERGGLNFPEEEAAPSYWDFAYFAFTLGMCFQVSDVTIGSSEIRRVALGHALISFLLNTGILALALNTVASVGT